MTLPSRKKIWSLSFTTLSTAASPCSTPPTSMAPSLMKSFSARSFNSLPAFQYLFSSTVTHLIALRFSVLGWVGCRAGSQRRSEGESWIGFQIRDYICGREAGCPRRPGVREGGVRGELEEAGGWLSWSLLPASHRHSRAHWSHGLCPFSPFSSAIFWVFLRLILPGWFSPVFGDSSYFPKFRSWLVNFCIIWGKCCILLKLLVHCTVWFCFCVFQILRPFPSNSLMSALWKKFQLPLKILINLETGYCFTSHFSHVIEHQRFIALFHGSSNF